MRANGAHATPPLRADFLTRNAQLGVSVRVLVRSADALNAFWPRRVASSETASKAIGGVTAQAVGRKTSWRKESGALHSAFAKRARGRRSGKLAMFSYARHALRASPCSGIGAPGEIPEYLRVSQRPKAPKNPPSGVGISALCVALGALQSRRATAQSERPKGKCNASSGRNSGTKRSKARKEVDGHSRCRSKRMRTSQPTAPTGFTCRSVSTAKPASRSNCASCPCE